MYVEQHDEAYEAYINCNLDRACIEEYCGETFIL